MSSDTGGVFSATVNQDTLIPYIQQNASIPHANEIAISLVKRYGYPGADDVLIQAFNSAFARGDYKSAALIAAKTKSNVLRTSQTIMQFKTAPAQPNQVTPILQYFSTLLEHGSLNASESLELVRPVIAQGRKEFVQKWFSEDKLECTEELGDCVRSTDSQLALMIYEKAKSSDKVLQMYLEQGSYEKIIAYVKAHGLALDCELYLRNMLNVNPEAAVNFANLALKSTPPLTGIQEVITVFSQRGRVQELTSILLDYLKGNNSKHAALQTQLFEMNIVHSPQVAEAIFQMNQFTHYDRHRIAQLCEKAGLHQRALEHYSEASDIKRVLATQSSTPVDMNWLVNYFGNLPTNVTMECLQEIVRSQRQNIKVAVQIALKHYEKLGTKNLIDLFETARCWDCLYYFLGGIITLTNDPDVHYTYIVATYKLNYMAEMERVCRESQHYDPVRVKNFLKEINVEDPRALIHVCDRNNFIPELVEYLYCHSQMAWIELYVLQVNPSQAPVVIGILLDLDCAEDFIKKLLQELRSLCAVRPLVEAVEKRNRLKIIKPWLEARVLKGIKKLSYIIHSLRLVLIQTVILKHSSNPMRFTMEKSLGSTVKIGIRIWLALHIRKLGDSAMMSS